MARAKALSDAAGQVLNAVDVKDPEALFTAAGDLYQTCSDCHAQYVFAVTPTTPQS
jgi:cytochrome c556